jgi:hypothetical protein
MTRMPSNKMVPTLATNLLPRLEGGRTWLTCGSCSIVLRGRSATGAAEAVTPAVHEVGSTGAAGRFTGGSGAGFMVDPSHTSKLVR